MSNSTLVPVEVPFSSRNYLDQLAVLIPYVVYHSRPVTSVLDSHQCLKSHYESAVSSAALISMAVALVYIGSYATLAKPRNAEDSVTDRDSPLYDPSDRDLCHYIKMNPGQLELLNAGVIDTSTAVLFPVFAALTLYLMWYLLSVDQEKLHYYMNWYVIAVLGPASYSTILFILGVMSRKVSYWLGIPGNSAWVFRRYRATLAFDQDAYPLGTLQQMSSTNVIETDVARFHRTQQFLHTQGVTFLEPTDVKASAQITNLVFDNRWTVVLPCTILQVLVFWYFNPVLGPASHSNWLVSNMVGMNFAVNAIKLVRTNTLRGAVILLALLFVYDVYFVFGTSIMVGVALQLDVPVKLVFPRAPAAFGGNAIQELLSDNITEYYKTDNALLGLGDVVLPSVLISMCLRFDLFLHHRDHRLAFHHLTPFRKSYFHAALVGYVIALMVTVVALHLTAHGQPALLYIVPSIFVSVGVTALIRGEFAALWSFTEEIKEYTDTKEEEDTTDLDYEASDIDESYDEWEARVEVERDAAALGTTAAHRERARPPIVYEFGDDSLDDDTFVIETDVDTDADDDDELIVIDSDISDAEDIEVLVEDNKSEPRVWYD